MSHRYPELDEMHEVFVRVLSNDPAPASDLAILWHEAIAMDRNPEAPSARTRGEARLRYFAGHKPLATQVPGQLETFSEDKLPHKVCTALISRNAADWNGPRSLTFRYERGPDGGWAGGYSVETSREHEDLVLGRKEMDARLSEALRAHWAPGVKRVGLVYGAPGFPDPGPRLKIQREQFEIVEADNATISAWKMLEKYLRDHGNSHVYYADMYLQKPDAKLREGDNVQLRYGR